MSEEKIEIKGKQFTWKDVIYRTVASCDAERFDDCVNDCLSHGWTPYGNAYGSGDMYCQVMIKYKEDAEESK